MIKIINETGYVDDTTIVDVKTGNEITGISSIEICRMVREGTIAIKLEFQGVQLQLSGRAVSVISEKGSFENKG